MKVYEVVGKGYVYGSGLSYTENLGTVETKTPDYTALELAESYADGIVNCDEYKIELLLDGEVVAKSWILTA